MLKIENELQEQSKRLDLLQRVESSGMFQARSVSCPSEIDESKYNGIAPDSLPIYSDEFLINNEASAKAKGRKKKLTLNQSTDSSRASLGIISRYTTSPNLRVANSVKSMTNSEGH